MPIPPKPFTLNCPQCGWHHTYRPVSDVLLIEQQCPKCGCKNLSGRSATWLEAATSLWWQGKNSVSRRQH